MTSSPRGCKEAASAVCDLWGRFRQSEYRCKRGYLEYSNYSAVHGAQPKFNRSRSAVLVETWKERVIIHDSLEFFENDILGKVAFKAHGPCIILTLAVYRADSFHSFFLSFFSRTLR